MASEDYLEYFYLVQYISSHKELNICQNGETYGPQTSKTPFVQLVLPKLTKLNWNCSTIWQCLTGEPVSMVSAEENLSLPDFHVGSIFFENAISL